MSDQELIKNILSGDPVAMRELVIKYQDLVVNTCFQVLHNKEDAEDIAQEVFLKAYQSLATLRHVECLSFWLYRISLNKSINHFNQNRIFRKIMRLDIPSDRVNCELFLTKNGKHDIVPGQQEESEKLEVIQRYLDKLPSKQKKAFILHHYECLSYNDIGQILNTSISSVESLLFRAKATLKVKCNEYYKQKNNTHNHGSDKKK